MDLTNSFRGMLHRVPAACPSPFNGLGAWAIATARRMYVALDGIHRWRLGVWEFENRQDCIIRLSREANRTARTLPDGTEVRRGDALLRLHYWNEHIPLVDEGGPTVAWAARFGTRARRSLRHLAPYLAGHSQFDDVVALVGETSVLSSEDVRTMTAFFRRLGFQVEVQTPRTALERIESFFLNLHVYLLIWGVNPACVKGRSPGGLLRLTIWMSRRTLLERYHEDRAVPSA